MRRRFFVERFDGDSATLRGEPAHHLGRVLRAVPGQLYELSDGQAVWLARTERVGREAIEFSLVEPLPARESRLRISLLLAIIKFDRFEWSLEKAAELGTTQIVPLAAARCEKALVAAAAKRALRWRKILLESAQQARRLRPPVLQPAVTPREAFRAAHARQPGISPEEPAVSILLSERAEAAPLPSGLEGKCANSVALAIGPEGGWTNEEFSEATQSGFAEVSLGPNILRTETAVVAALAAIQYALGAG